MNHSEPPPSGNHEQESLSRKEPSRGNASELQKRIWRSEELFGEENEVLIVHDESVYRLRRTRNGKLILHK